jgi:hypothetical protein
VGCIHRHSFALPWRQIALRPGDRRQISRARSQVHGLAEIDEPDSHDTTAFDPNEDIMRTQVVVEDSGGMGGLERFAYAVAEASQVFSSGESRSKLSTLGARD